MEHHSHAHHIHAVESLNVVYYIAIALNFGFVIVEALAGVYSNSTGLLSDAGHKMIDVFSLLIALLAFRLAASKPSSRYTYGYRKASVLISLFNALLLVCAVCVIVFESVTKLMEPAPVNGAAVSWTAAAGILVSGISALLMMRFQKKDINTRGAFLHMATDSLLSLGVVISGIVISLSGLYVIDPIVSLVIAAVILYNSVRLLGESVRMIIDGVPGGVDYDAVKSLVAGCGGVKAVEELHVWAVSINQTALTARVAVDGDAGAVHRTLHEELEKRGFSPVTIETI
mgnify:FL=1